MARILLAALAVFLLAWPAATDVQAASNGTEARACVRVVRHATGDMLENGCVSCRLVSVQRTRTGASPPTSQTLTVPERTRQPLPFRGPGQTRITAERPCPGAAPEPVQAEAASASGQKCVRFIRTRANGSALINPCAVCRAVKVEFVDSAGNRTHRAYAIAAHSPLGFPSAGLAEARILVDAPCG